MTKHFYGETLCQIYLTSGKMRDIQRCQTDLTSAKKTFFLCSSRFIEYFKIASAANFFGLWISYLLKLFFSNSPPSYTPISLIPQLLKANLYFNFHTKIHDCKVILIKRTIKYISIKYGLKSPITKRSKIHIQSSAAWQLQSSA